MTTAKKLIAAAGAAGAGEATYVDDVFSTYLYEGTGVNQVIDNGIALADEGGLIWFKSRTSNDNNCLYDTERGAGKVIFSDTTGVQLSASGGQQVTFRSAGNTGFETGTGYGGSENKNGEEICSWTFRKAPGFFDVVTYTGTGSAQNISHNLGSVPGCIIIKNTSNTADWTVYHRGVDASAPEDYNLALNKTDAKDNNVAYFNDTAPTSTVFTVNSDSTTNTNGDTYVAYLFAHDAQEFGTDSDESIIKCGSVTTSAGTDYSTAVTGSVNLGFEPQWILIKPADSTGDWLLVDVMRGITTPYGDFSNFGNDAFMYANTVAAESEYGFVNATPTGFDIYRLLGSTKYIYMAIRRPHKPASEFAATDLFAIDTRSSALPAFTSGFPVDMSMFRDVQTTVNGSIMGSRLIQGRALRPHLADAETAVTSYVYDYQDGWMSSANLQPNQYSWMWRRAPGFFDVVCYTGSGSAGTMTINHNLGVVPEMMWVKARNASYNWWAAHTFTASNAVRQYPSLNGVQAGSTESYGTSLGLNAQPTSTSFVVNTDTMIGRGYDWVAYLFATVDGISKVGSYTGTGNDVNVNCGFSSGARFVMVKRTDSTGDWYLWDSSRGIVAGDDPYLLLNTTAAQVTNTDYIDPLSSGFTVTSSAPAALNASGGTYIFYAIA